MSFVDSCKELVDTGVRRTPKCDKLKMRSPYFSRCFDFKDNLWQLSLEPHGYDINFRLCVEVSLAHICGCIPGEKITIGVQDAMNFSSRSFYPPYKFPLHNCFKITLPFIPEKAYRGKVRVIFEITRKEKCQAKYVNKIDRHIVSNNMLLQNSEIDLNESNNDVIVKLKDKEVKCQRCILSNASEVVRRLLCNETTSKNKGIFDISDIDHATFLDFLEFLHTGNIKTLIGNVLELFKTAKKHEVNELEDFCKDHILKNITAKNFPEVLTLSILHKETELTHACYHFFAENVFDITLTSEWRAFLKEYPTACIELHNLRIKMNKLQLYSLGFYH